jgi:hypothetical protein
MPPTVYYALVSGRHVVYYTLYVSGKRDEEGRGGVFGVKSNILFPTPI